LGDLAFSLIIPTYNERENLEELISKSTNILNKLKIKYEIIIADDNSPDQTWKLADEISKDFPCIRVLRRFRNKGLTPSVLEGMETASGNILGVMDADLQHDISVLPQMLEECKMHDLVIGSRYTDSSTKNSLSLPRKLLSKSGTYFARILLGLKISDPLSGYFLVKREVFKELSSDINAKGFKILLQILGRNKNLKIKEIPYSFSERKKGSTKLNDEVAIDFLSELFSLRFKRKVSSRFVRYSITGFSGVFINLFGQSISQYILGVDTISYANKEFSLPGISVTIGFSLSVINNFYWNNRWTFRDKKISGIYANVRGLINYFIITCVGFLIQFSVWRFLIDVFLNSFGYSEKFTYLANLVGILSATTWNYYVSKNFMWKIE
jgi:dolichol-phosphate mannosyltransferase